MNPWHMQTTVQVYMQEHPNIYVNLYRWKFWRPAEHSRTVDKLNDGACHRLIVSTCWTSRLVRRNSRRELRLPAACPGLSLVSRHEIEDRRHLGLSSYFSTQFLASSAPPPKANPMSPLSPAPVAFSPPIGAQPFTSTSIEAVGLAEAAELHGALVRCGGSRGTRCRGAAGEGRRLPFRRWSSTSI